MLFFSSKKRTCHEYTVSFFGSLFPILSLFRNYDAFKFKDKLKIVFLKPNISLIAQVVKLCMIFVMWKRILLQTGSQLSKHIRKHLDGKSKSTNTHIVNTLVALYEYASKT